MKLIYVFHQTWTRPFHQVVFTVRERRHRVAQLRMGFSCSHWSVIKAISCINCSFLRNCGSFADPDTDPLGKQNAWLMLDAKETFHSQAALLVIICCHNPKTIANPWEAGCTCSGHVLAWHACVYVWVCFQVSVSVCTCCQFTVMESISKTQTLKSL